MSDSIKPIKPIKAVPATGENPAFDQYLQTAVAVYNQINGEGAFAKLDLAEVAQFNADAYKNFLGAKKPRPKLMTADECAHINETGKKFRDDQQNYQQGVQLYSLMIALAVVVWAALMTIMGICVHVEWMDAYNMDVVMYPITAALSALIGWILGKNRR